MREAGRETAAGGRSGLLYAGPFIMYVDRFSMGPMLLPIARDLHQPLAAVAQAATAYFVLYGAMQVVYGLLSDRLGRVRLMRVASLGAGLAAILSAAAPNLAVLVAGRALTAALICSLFPSALTYIGDRFPFRVRQRAVADLLAVVAVGMTLANLGAGLLAAYASWRLGFLLPGIALLALAFALRWLPESLPDPGLERPLAQLRRLATRPWMVFLFLVTIPEGAAVLGFFTFLAPALEARGTSPGTAGAVVAVYGLAVLLATRAVKRLTTRVRPHLLIVIGGSALLLGFAVAALAQSVATILVAGVTCGLAYAVMHSTFQTWATEVAPESRGTATALFPTAAFLGAGLCTIATAGLADAGRYGELFWIGAAVTVPVVAIGAAGRWRFPEREGGDAGGGVIGEGIAG
ncbi:MAG TPA: MFS transporter [Candidatus Dormibacteraeota bacterium]|nr:MFS transporter [Candidatus Dormibacteraeota bacterium]